METTKAPHKNESQFDESLECRIWLTWRCRLNAELDSIKQQEDEEAKVLDKFQQLTKHRPINPTKDWIKPCTHSDKIQNFHYTIIDFNGNIQPGKTVNQITTMHFRARIHQDGQVSLKQTPLPQLIVSHNEIFRWGGQIDG